MWNLPDTKSLRVLNDNTLFWIGEYYSDNVQESLKATMQDYFTGGYNRKELATLMRVHFKDLVNKPKSYWDLLADHICTKTREIGRVSGYEQAGIEVVRIRARIDDRTTEFCRRVHGHILSIRDMRGMVDRYLEACETQDKEKIKKAWPWWSDKDSANRLRSPDDINKWISRGKIGPPPYHARCRTITVAEFEYAPGSHVNDDLPEGTDPFLDEKLLPVKLPKAPVKPPKKVKVKTEGEKLYDATVRRVNPTTIDMKTLRSANPEWDKLSWEQQAAKLDQYAAIKAATKKAEKDAYFDALPSKMKDPDAVIAFDKYDHDSADLNGVPLKAPAAPPDFSKLKNKHIGEPAFDFDAAKAKGKHAAAGVIIEEPDGRIWIYEPKNHFGGYEHTFPKGTLEDGYTLQQTAVKEAFEESGLMVEIQGFVGDFEKTSSITRYYRAKRIGGDPGAAHWEAERVKLVPADKAKDMLNVSVDKKILAEYLQQKQKKLDAIAQAGGKTAADLEPDEKAALTLFTNKLKKGQIVGPKTKSMQVWDALSPQAQHDIIDGLQKDGISIPDGLPIKHLNKPAFAPAPTQQPTVRSVPAIDRKPLDIDDYTKYGNQEGSNTGGFYQSKTNPAERWYMKFPDNDDIARNEMLAAKLYEAAGVEVPTLKWVKSGDRVGIASRIIDGVEINPNKLMDPSFRDGIYDDFVVDAWLGDWDVVGLKYDNLQIFDNKRAIRIDVGGSLRYRAMGGMKGQAFGDTVGEIDSLRNPGTNRQAANVFGDITQAELEAGAKKVLRVTDKQIEELVNEYGPANKAERDMLVKKLIARREDIRKKFPNVKIDAKPAAAPPDIDKRVTDADLENIKNARINGHTIPTDEDMIEDHDVLVWQQQAVDGSPQTACTFKLRPGQDKKLSAQIATAAKGAPAPNEIPVAGAQKDLLTMIKGVGMQAKNGGPLRDKDILRAQAALKTWDDLIRQIDDAIVKKHIKISAKTQLEQTFKPWIYAARDIAKRQPGETALGLLPDGIVFPTNTMPGIQMKLPPSAAPKTAGIQWQKKVGTFEEKKIVNGKAQLTGDNILLSIINSREYQHLYEADINGTRVRYWPNEPDIAMAHRGKVEILTAGADSAAANKLFDVMEELGVKTNVPDALDIEEVYLVQTLKHLSRPSLRADIDDILSRHANDKTARVSALKEKLLVELRKDPLKDKVEDLPNYNPTGKRQAFDNGHIHKYRPDLEGKEWEDFQKDYIITHQITKGDIVSNIDLILNGGGQMAPSTDKLRRGFSWGGMSPTQDMDTGGASYFFTRIASRSAVETKSAEGFYWKPKLVSRLDAMSYTHDKFGNVKQSVIDTYRRGNVKGWKECAKNWSIDSGNETNFKNSLSVFDDLEFIVVSPSKYNAAMDTLRKHLGGDTWPDGRDITEVVFKQSDIGKALKRHGR